VLSEEESKKFFESTGLSPDQLPKINSNDAAIKAQKAEAGRVVKITRKSDVDGKSELVYYRVVPE